MKIFSPNQQNGRKAGVSSSPLNLTAGILSVLVLIPALIGCTTKKHVIVEPLFFNMREITITPLDEGNGAEGGNISETVEYTNRLSRKTDVRQQRKYDQDDSQLDTTAAYMLSEVKITSHNAFTTERDGKLDIRFRVNIPREVLSSKWRLTLQPQMKYNDTLVDLPPMYFKGFEFTDMQNVGYDKWNDYLAEIVDEKDYGKHFVDSAGVNHDIAKLQQFFFEEYDKEVKEYNKYLERKRKLEQQALEAGMRSEIKKREKYLEQIRQNDFDQVSKAGGELDSKGEIKPVMPVFNSEWRPRNIPKKYMDILDAAEDRTSSSVNKKDSVFIASRRYKMDEIVRNEMRDSLKEAMLNEFIPYPYETWYQLDTTIGSMRDLKYVYSTSYPYVPGMSSLKITLQGKVDAIDKSVFVLPTVDTLNLTISTMDQLFDMELVHKKIKVYRNVFANLTVHPSYDARNGVEIGYGGNRAVLDTIVSSWNSYLSMGYRVDSVAMTASTSLEGSYDKNEALTKERVAAFKSFLAANAPASMNVNSVFRAAHIGEDWAGLLRMVRRNNDLKDKERIVNIITTASNPDATEAIFKQQLAADDYRILQRDIYPKLNKVDLVYYLSYPGLQSADSVLVEERPDYARAVELFNARDYWGAMDIMSNYPDYNLALCMTILGFNDRAYDLLQMLEQNADVEYLSAIVAYRLSMKSRAEEHLIRACELDYNKTLRAQRDPDIKALIKERDLSGVLDKLMQTPTIK